MLDAVPAAQRQRDCKVEDGAAHYILQALLCAVCQGALDGINFAVVGLRACFVQVLRHMAALAGQGPAGVHSDISEMLCYDLCAVAYLGHHLLVYGCHCHAWGSLSKHTPDCLERFTDTGPAIKYA